MKIWKYMMPALMLAGPAAAQETGTEASFASLSREDIELKVRDYLFASQIDHCVHGVSLGQELRRRLPNEPRSQAMVDYADLNCAAQKGDFQTAYRGLVALEGRGFKLTDAFGLYLAERTKDISGSLTRLRRFLLSTVKFPQLSREFPTAYAAIRMLLEANEAEQLGALALNIMQDAEFTQLDKGMRSDLALLAIDQAVRADHAVASDLLTEIGSPAALRRLLLLRQYQPVWPAVEQKVGPHFSIADEQYLSQMRLAYEKDSDNSARMRAYVAALWEVGKTADVVSFVEQAAPVGDDFSEIGEDMAWIINIYAFSLDAHERVAEADILFDRLAGIENKYWQVNFVVNRAARLTDQGRWQEALAAQPAASAVATASGTDYSRAIAAQVQLCSLSKLGRSQEAAALLPSLRQLGTDAAWPVAEALMCMDRDEEAAALVASTVADPVYGEDFALELLSDTPDALGESAALPSLKELIENYPSVRDALLKRARLFPEEFQRVES
ncbi:hypothetical protein GRI97_03570 [Altererythrobacter xixiisoli]|uniref:Uncharacterized protein n=1 Tax=Croceibacterium xixiisoli TaxID=1476466 RepID=A0A6I4TT70_9SPHN|nr:hypothetical protein [Croceibacterium xixiisoli]MXO98067.1 hypothetical protein [Croceibacterium xixiisoli]